MAFAQVLAATPASDGRALRWLLSPGAPPPARPSVQIHELLLLSGPEGGLSAGEVSAAKAAGFEPVGLGPRVLRAETAPLAALAWLSCLGGGA